MSSDIPPIAEREAFFAADWDARLRALAREICRLPTQTERWARIDRFAEAQGIADEKNPGKQACAAKNVERLKTLCREEWSAMKGGKS